MRDNCISGPKYCPNCGKELDTYETSCKYCRINLRQLNQNKKRKKE
ncbi:MAG: hypothetical protein ACFE9S_19595 [Candidatus Hermodarchaeota archaeon]